jgi:hypothetical protein
MPESTCLHIQDRESGPIRVVELPWISVRIGRAAYCEVRLPDAKVAEEACRLTRRGRTWSLIPSSDKSDILFEGRPLNDPCPLPFDVPFQMGPYCLTLRHDLTAEPNWEVYPAHSPSQSIEPRYPVEPATVPLVAADLGSAETGRAAATSPAEAAGKRGLDPDRWRVRWKAAESHFKSRAARLDADVQRSAYATSPDSLRETDRSLSRPTASGSTPAGPPIRAVPTSSARRIEPTWNAPRPVPTPATPRLGPVLRPTPRSAAEHAEWVASTSAEPAIPPASVSPEVDVSEDASRFLIAENPADLVVETVIATALPPGVDRCNAIDKDPFGDDSQPAIVIAPEPAAASEPVSAPADPSPEDIDPAIDETVSTANEDASGPLRNIEPSPKSRKPRDRIGGGRRSGPHRRPRAEAGAPDSSAGPEAIAPAFTGAELPSVRDILVNHRNSRGPRPAVERQRRGNNAVPTIPQEPGHWTFPGWLALPPVGAFMLGVGLLACLLSCWWAADSSTAGVLTQRLLGSDGSGRRRPLPPEITPPGGRWIKTTAEHLAQWAIYTAGAENHDPFPPSEAPAFVTHALEISPLNPTARMALAQLEGPGRDGSGRIRGLGLSRDSVSLAWSARRLMDAGRKEAALRLYHRALSAAVEGGLSRSSTPRFADDPMVRRYFLPAEDAVRDIVAELASREGLEFREWSRALPRHPTVVLATARLLHEQGRREADSLLDELVGGEWGRSDAGWDDPRLMAARAEALGLRSRWKEAAYQYRLAIERVDNDLIRRSWWFNLADIAERLDDESQRQAAFRAVLAAQSSDEIARRVSQIQRSGDAKARAREGYGSIKAN